MLRLRWGRPCLSEGTFKMFQCGDVGVRRVYVGAMHQRGLTAIAVERSGLGWRWCVEEEARFSGLPLSNARPLRRRTVTVTASAAHIPDPSPRTVTFENIHTHDTTPLTRRCFCVQLSIVGSVWAEKRHGTVTPSFCPARFSPAEHSGIDMDIFFSFPCLPARRFNLRSR